jgi:uncharacterized membrane protein
MRSRIRAAGHAVHPMLMVFPLGLFTTSVVFDVLHLTTDRAGFAVTAAHLIAAGLLFGVVAAVTGWLDWWLVTPPGSRARRVGLIHGAVNTTVMALFAVSWLLRLGQTDWQPSWAALLVAWVGVLGGGVGGWLGGELVERLGISVEEDAHPDAASSLRGSRPATSS